MRPIITFAIAAAFLCEAGVLSAQQVDPGIVPFDPSANSRVQDPDRPDSPLLPAGNCSWSSPWTLQPIMSGTSFAGTFGPAQNLGPVIKASQFPSLGGTSVWGPSSASAAWTGQPVMSDASSAGASGPAPRTASISKVSQFPSLIGISVWGPSSSAASSYLNANGARGQTQSAARSTKAVGSRNRKLDVTMARAYVQSARMGRREDEFSVDALAVQKAIEQTAEQNEPSDPHLKLRQLKQELKQSAAAARSARLRIANPFQSKADASTAHWGRDASSLSALGQQQHETGTLLHYGFNARNKPRRWHRGAVHTPGSRDYPSNWTR